MKSDFWLEQIPLWGVFLLTVVMVMLSIWVGTLLGRRRRHQPDHEAEAAMGTIISATLGLLAFMLAFTFGIAAGRLQTRKQLLLDEINAIGTTYLRAGLLLEPHRSEICKLLRQYVDIRANLAKENQSQQVKKLPEVISRSEALQNQMWLHAEALAQTDRGSPIDALFIDSLNQMIDIHTSRMTVFQYHIPPPIWYVLYFITLLSMVAVGYHAGLSGKSSFRMSVVLALTFSAVVFLIADLDRATGSLRVSQQPMLELQKKLQSQTQNTGYEQIHPDSKGTSDKEASVK
jgi:hypothetical protein